MAREHYLSGAWQTDTLYGLARGHATERGNAYAVRDSARRLTWNALVAAADAVAQELHEAGLRRGDRVSSWLPSRIESVVVMLACSRNGYVCNPSLHQNYTVAEIIALLSRIECRALFAQSGWGADAGTTNVFACAAELSHMKRVYALPALHGDNAPLPAGAYAMPESGLARNVLQPPPSTHPDQIVYLAFTSGTTGTPKGVMHSDNTLLANGRAMVADWGHDATTVLLTLSPMSHHIGTVALEQTLVAGCELVVRDSSSKMTLLEWIEETDATYVMGVPTHAMDVLAAARKADRKRLGKVRGFYMAGAPIPQQTAEEFLALGVTPQNVYGMTENGSHQYTLPTDDVATITKTCGKACRAYEIKLWDQANRNQEAGPGEVGEIGGRGAVLTLGYFANQAATEGSFNDSGWFLSGDLGQFDANGNLLIVGRAKDLIIRGGHNIHPSHIEALAMRHKGVGRVARVGVADEGLGEKGCLAVIPAGPELSS